ncbi:MAG TPA: hypothetical protein VFW48_11110 [Solirubrobacterales bacterium]|nr:hypothetical protein [Solirubrobacterales bacterium]
MRIPSFIVCALALGLLVGCGASDESELSESELSPGVLLERIDAQFDRQEGSDTPQAKALVKTFPENSLISCWDEDGDRVCAVTFSDFPSGGQSFSRTLDYWDFYLAVFDPGSEDPDIEQVDAEEALSPSRRSG